jgi:hypothetical protein
MQEAALIRKVTERKTSVPAFRMPVSAHEIWNAQTRLCNVARSRRDAGRPKKRDSRRRGRPMPAELGLGETDVRRQNSKPSQAAATEAAARKAGR